MTDAQLAPGAPGYMISTAAQADEFAAHLVEVMERLLELVDEETDLVRAGRIADVARLEPHKTELARVYIANIARLKANMRYFKERQPKILAPLAQRHAMFQALLQINLTVLATVHAVAEGILRGVSQELNGRAAPDIYGASGLKTIPHARHSAPLTVSRSL